MGDVASLFFMSVDDYFIEYVTRVTVILLSSQLCPSLENRDTTHTHTHTCTDKVCYLQKNMLIQTFLSKTIAPYFNPNMVTEDMHVHTFVTFTCDKCVENHSFRSKNQYIN